MFKKPEAIPFCIISFGNIYQVHLSSGTGKSLSQETRSHTIVPALQSPRSRKIPIIIKIWLFRFYVTSLAVNEGQPSCQSTEGHRYNVMCQPLMFLFYEISFYNLAVSPLTDYKCWLIENRYINQETSLVID